MLELSQPEAPAGVRGWLLVLCALLLVWQPVSLGLAASSALDALVVRGLPLALLLMVRLLVAALGIGAGLALLARRGGAVAMAKTALLASGSTDVLVYTTPYFPSNRPPGDAVWFVAWSIVYHAVWLVYLFRSARVRNTY